MLELRQLVYSWVMMVLTSLLALSVLLQLSQLIWSPPVSLQAYHYSTRSAAPVLLLAPSQPQPLLSGQAVAQLVSVD